MKQFAPYIITKILCPACDGTGKTSGLGIRCGWCLGSRRMQVGEVDEWAAFEEMIASGDYVVNGGTYEDLVTARKKIERARHLAAGPRYEE